MSASPSLATLRAALAADRARLRAAVDTIPVDARQTRPSPERWSVAEVLEHISLVEGRVAMLLGALVPDAPRLEAGVTGTATVLDRTGLRNRSTRINAPAAIQPTGSLSASEAWAALEKTRQQLLVVIDRIEAEHVDLSKVSRAHPVLGPLDGYQWIEATGGHEERHTVQIVEIGAALAGAPPV